jgi:endonuclease/exonuclease/phosphatase (EEP) superfamily protein YafD
VTATLLGAVLLVISLAGVLLHAVAWRWQPLVVAASMAHYVMLAVAPGVLLAMLARRWIMVAASVLLIAAVAAVQLPPLIASTPPRDFATLTVLQANLHVGSADAGALVQLLAAHRVDLLATEELTTAEQQRLVAAGLQRRLPYRYTAPLPDGGGGLGIWSRYPLSGGRNLAGYELGVLDADVAMPRGLRLRFVAVHLLPPYPYAPGEWLAESARLRDHLAGLGSSVLVAGDFNATVDHAQFRRLVRDGYVDAADQAGAGYLPTYPTDRWTGPLIAIDHVLTRGGVATSMSTVSLPGSDHRGLLVRVALPRA